MLQVRGLKVFNGSFVLNADFDLKTSSLISILGPSGSGKSTLLNSLAGFLPLSSGHVLWKDREISNLDIAERPLDILFQENNFFPHLTVKENVKIGIRANLKLSKPEEKLVLEAIKKVGLDNHADKKPSELSGGQKTRIALARTILRSRELLLLDEVFLGLGPALRLEMLALVRNFVLSQKVTLLMVTHDLKDAVKLGGEIIFVDSGTILGPFSLTCFTSSDNMSIRHYLGNESY